MTNDNDRVMLTPQGIFITMLLDLGYPLDVALAYWNTFSNDLVAHEYIIVREDEAREPTEQELAAAISRAIAHEEHYTPERVTDRQSCTKPCLTCTQCHQCKKTAAECKRYAVWFGVCWANTTADLKITAHTVRPKFKFSIKYPD